MLRRILAILLFAFCLQAQDTTPYRVRLAGSGYSAQLRGVTGTRTAGVTVQGAYTDQLNMHSFSVATEGYYTLWYDVNGGSTYTMDSRWAPVAGKYIPGPDGMETPDSSLYTYHLSTQLEQFIQAAGDTANIENFPDGVYIDVNMANQLRIKETFLADSVRLPYKTIYGNTAKYGIERVGLLQDRRNSRKLRLENYATLTPNDTSVDNSSAIEALIDTAIALGAREIEIAEKYNIKNPIDIQGEDSLTFIGITPHAGFTSTYRFPSDYATANYHEGLFSIDSTKYLRFINLNFDCNAAAWFPASQMHPFRFRSDDGYSSNITIEKCYFDDCANIQFRDVSGLDTAIVDAWINDNYWNATIGDAAMRFIGKSYNVNITNNRYYGNNVGDHFILSPGGINHIVKGNMIFNTYDSAIYYSSGPVTITENLVIRAGKDAIKVVHNPGNFIGRQAIISKNQVYIWGVYQGGLAYNYQGDLFVNNKYTNLDSTSARLASLTGNIYATWNPATGEHHGQVQGMKIQGSDVYVSDNIGLGGSDIFSGQPGTAGMNITSGSHNVVVDGGSLKGWEKGIIVGGFYRDLEIKNMNLVGQGFDSGGNAAIYVEPLAGADSARNELTIKNNTIREFQRGFWINNADSVYISGNESKTTFNTGSGYDLIMNSSSNFLEQHNNWVVGEPVVMKPIITDSIKIGGLGFFKGGALFSGGDSMYLYIGADTIKAATK